MNKYDEMDVVRSLQKKNDVHIHGKELLVLRGSAAKNDLGNKSKGKIDFLTRHCGYHLQFVTKF